MNEVTTAPLVFLAEDDAAMRSMHRMLLTRSGFVVVACPDGAALIAEIEATRTGGPRPQVIISDVQMPGASGLDVVDTSTRVLPGVPIILITAFGDDRTHRRARELGATAVLNKPFILSDLQNLVTKAVTASTGG
jgi:CheY-like chemotaxis protein